MQRARIPGLTDRMQALAADALIIFALMYIATLIFEKIGEVAVTPRILVYIFLFFV